MIGENIYYVGVNDHQLDLFESQYPIPNGMAYNSYIIKDEKTVVVDSVDANFYHEWLNNIEAVLGEQTPDYLVVQHMEPDHGSSVEYFISKYPDTTIVTTAKALQMINQFFNTDYSNQVQVVKEGDVLEIGSRSLSFYMMPMVHWPEVMVTYDSLSKTIFSADAFGKFGALDIDEPWIDEARRYYIGIVGKYGSQVQSALKKIGKLEINRICSLHGPILEENIQYYIDLYNKWSSYEAEDNSIVFAYSSAYGHTRQVVLDVVAKLQAKTDRNILVYDLARSDVSEVVARAFACQTLVLASITYNMDIFPHMKDFINHLVERNFQNKQVAFIENGSWAPSATKIMTLMLEKSKNIEYISSGITIKSACSDALSLQLEEFVDCLIE